MFLHSVAFTCCKNIKDLDTSNSSCCSIYIRGSEENRGVPSTVITVLHKKSNKEKYSSTAENVLDCLWHICMCSEGYNEDLAKGSYLFIMYIVILQRICQMYVRWEQAPVYGFTRTASMFQERSM